MNRQLMKAIVDAIVFIGVSGDDVVDPDAAVAHLEAIASELRLLTRAEKAVFVEFVNECAREAASRGESKELLDFIRGIPDSLGL